MARNSSFPKTIDKDKLLYVEGDDDFYFILKFLDHLNIKNIDVRSYGGKDNLSNVLGLLKSLSGFEEQVKVIGILRDADSNGPSAFQSVCSALRNNCFAVPEREMTFTNSVPAIAVKILPNAADEGKLETLLLKSVKNDPAMCCVNKFIECLKKNSIDFGDEEKTTVHAFLSTRKKPYKLIGTAAQCRYWNFECVEFSELKKFLISISNYNL